MFGGGYDQEQPHEPMDGRPAKRARNGAGVPDHGQMPTMTMSDGSASLMLPPQHRLDIQVVPPTTASRGRQGEDRNNRKLSCKECRRCVLSHVLYRIAPNASCVLRLKLKVRQKGRYRQEEIAWLTHPVRPRFSLPGKLLAEEHQAATQETLVVLRQTRLRKPLS